jgi:hypothetical protein
MQCMRIVVTWTYSTTALSPRSRIADTFVAGKPFGTMFRTVFFRELVIDKEDIVTAVVYG